MSSNEQQKMPKMKPKKMPKFYCKFCDFKSSKKSNFTTHLSTPKHQCNIMGSTCNKKKPKSETLKHSKTNKNIIVRIMFCAKGNLIAPVRAKL